MEAAAGIEPAIKVLQTFALPLGYAALIYGLRIDESAAQKRRNITGDGKIRDRIMDDQRSLPLPDCFIDRHFTIQNARDESLIENVVKGNMIF